jgi:hypothetical protein
MESGQCEHQPNGVSAAGVLTRLLWDGLGMRRQDLPIRVPLIRGETTASFLMRTAAANGLPHRQLLKTLHQGRFMLRGGVLRPWVEELFLSEESLRLLGWLVDRPVERLLGALPDLRAEHAVPSPHLRLRIVAWRQEFGQGPLPACPLCMEPGAWLVAGGQRWRPCGCGRRWMVGDRGGYLMDTATVPDLGRALLVHRVLVRRRGPAGDALVADAHQVALWWWVSKQVARDLWRPERTRSRSAPGCGAARPPPLSSTPRRSPWPRR